MINLNEKVKVVSQQLTSNPIAYTYLWFYRLIGITFGGLSIDSNGKFHINRCLKLFGYFYAIVFSVVFVICFSYMLTTERFKSLYADNDRTAYFVVIFYYTSQLVHIIINLWYLNRKGLTFVRIFVTFQMQIQKNQRILFGFWIIHVLVPILSLFYRFLTTDIIEKTNLFFLFNYCAFNLLSFYYFWVISIIMWIISIHSYEKLTGIKAGLQEEIEKLQGILLYIL